MVFITIILAEVSYKMVTVELTPIIVNFSLQSFRTKTFDSACDKYLIISTISHFLLKYFLLHIFLINIARKFTLWRSTIIENLFSYLPPPIDDYFTKHFHCSIYVSRNLRDHHNLTSIR